MVTNLREPAGSSPSGQDEPTPAFDAGEYARRVDRVQEALRARGIDVLLSHIPENIYYLTGYQTVGYYAYQCLAVPAEGSPVLCVRGLERELALALSWLGGDDVHGYADTEDPIAGSLGALRGRGLLDGRVGVEMDAWFFTLRAHRQLTGAIGGDLADASGVVESLRLVKSAAEVAVIRAAARAADASMDAAARAVAAGGRERDVAAAMYQGGLAAGSEYMSLPPFVASGTRSALGHATWSAKPLERGDAVFLEVSGAVARYSAALMRTAVVGPADDERRRIAAALDEALDAAIDAMRPGAVASEVDAACRRPVEAAGYGEWFKHRAGYSIGINFPPDWGEGHIASLRGGSDLALRAGMVFHVIPAALIPGRHGIGMSETVLVTESGAEQLGTFPRGLIET